MRADDAGYTLVEALTAILIVALALGGLTEAVRLVVSSELSSQKVRQAAAQTAKIAQVLREIPEESGPFRLRDDGLDGDLRGDADGAVFTCGDAQTCRLTVSAAGDGGLIDVEVGQRRRQARLKRAAGLRLGYLTDASNVPLESWPPASGARRLDAIIVSRHHAVLGLVRFPATQRTACGFDASLQDCAPASGRRP
jgi:hypothetical protein